MDLRPHAGSGDPPVDLALSSRLERTAGLTQFRDVLALAEQHLLIPTDQTVTVIALSDLVDQVFHFRLTHDRRRTMTNILPYRKRRATDDAQSLKPKA